MHASEPVRFVTSDGYTFHLIGGRWVDSLDEDTIDMAYDATADLWPVDVAGERLPGVAYDRNGTEIGRKEE